MLRLFLPAEELPERITELLEESERANTENYSGSIFSRGDKGPRIVDESAVFIIFDNLKSSWDSKSVSGDLFFKNGDLSFCGSYSFVSFCEKVTRFPI